MIHYHGTPITPRSALAPMAGRHFCVSFAAPGDLRWCLSHGASVMLDNGAFSAWTRGATVEWAPGLMLAKIYASAVFAAWKWWRP